MNHRKGRMECGQKKLRTISYEGEVTDINYSLCYFVMDEVIEVYATHYKYLPLINETITLKNVLLYNRKTFILTKKSEIKNSHNDEYLNLDLMYDFQQFISGYKLKTIEHKKIKSMYEQLIDLQVEIVKDNVHFSTIDVSSLLLDVLEDIYIFSDSKRSPLLDLAIYLPRHFETTPESKQGKFVYFKHWNAGIYKSNENDILIGLLNISNKTGFLMLSDTKSELPIIIAKNDYNFSSKIMKLLNNFVYLKDYIHITESYKDTGEINFIYTDIGDIKLIERPSVSVIMDNLEKVLTYDDTNLFKIKFIVLNKSSLTQKNGQKYFFIRVKYLFELDTMRECIFKFTEQIIQLYPIINENDTYCIFTKCKEFENSFMKQDSETIFTIFQKRLLSYTLPVDIKLKLAVNKDGEDDEEDGEEDGEDDDDVDYIESEEVEDEESEEDEEVEDEESEEEEPEDPLIVDPNEIPYVHTVDEALKFLKSTEKKPNKKLINIQGIVTNRKFFPQLKKTASNECKLKPFGIPGNMVHNITLSNDLKIEYEGEGPEEVTQSFTCEGDESYEKVFTQYCEGTESSTEDPPPSRTVHVDIFMHNFHNLQCPLGLVPDMRVLFKSLTAIKGKYFKPTIFTAIEIISYEPEFSFNSANIVLDNNDWGPQISLGSGNDIPTNQICWGSTILVEITQLLVKFKCALCKNEISKYSDNGCCGEFDYEWDLFLCLSVKDAGGACKVITNSDKVLQVLLNKNETEWSFLRKSLKIIKYFSFRDDDDDDADEETEVTNDTDDFCQSSEFADIFSLLLRAWNEAKLHNVDLKCRKMENRVQNPEFKPCWWCLDARRSFS